jgi:tetratricopeptide (TPR) repeat protein
MQPPEVIVASCTKSLSDASLGPEQRAKILEQRGLAEGALGDDVKATSDYDAAITLWLGLAKSLSIDRYDPHSDNTDQTRRLIELKPNIAVAFYVRGLARRRLGDHAGAMSDYGEAIKLRPEFPEAFRERALLWKTLGNRTEELSDLNESIRLRPDFAAALSLRGALWADLHQDDKAIADFTDAIKLSPTMAGAFIGRGTIWDDKLNYDRAIQDYSEAIALRPGLALAYMDRAVALSKNGDYARALADDNAAMDLYAKGTPGVPMSDSDERLNSKSEYATALSNRSDVRLHLGDIQGALSDADAATQLDTSEPHAWNAACWARAVADRDLDVALSDCNRSIQIAGDDTTAWEAYDSRATVRYRRGEYTAAVEDEGLALKLAPNQAGPLFVRSLAEARVNMTSEATADAKAALAVDPKIADTYATWGMGPLKP